MKSVEFCYWLQGLFELGNPQSLDSAQTDLVKRHLAMVFKHEIDPSYGNEKAQQALTQLHSAVAKPTQPSFGGTGPNGEVLRC